MKQIDRTPRALWILLGIIVIIVLLMLEAPGMTDIRKDTSAIRFPLSNFEYPISRLKP